MKNRVYLLSKIGDPFELPVGVFDTANDVAQFVGCSVGHVWNSLSWRITETDNGVVIGGYVVEVIELLE